MLKDTTKPIKDESTCMCCLKEDALNKFVRINIKPLGYGSQFDNTSTKLILCPECYKQTNPLWWEFHTVSTEECGILFDVYEYENEIVEFVKGFPMNGQERFYNSLSSHPGMSQEDWIWWQLNKGVPFEVEDEECIEEECDRMLWETTEELFEVKEVLCEALTELFVPRELKRENLKVVYDYEDEEFIFPTTMGGTTIKELSSISKLIKDTNE